jgi:DNA-binding GntR family transcriptional regulator
LVKLEKEGFVVSVPRGGTFVREISEREIKEIYEIREALEILAIKLAVKRIDDETVSQLKETGRMFEEAIRSRDIRLCHQHDLKFHQLLVMASGNERLSMMMENIHHQFSIMISRSPEYWSRADASLRDHLSIIESLSKKDGDRAGETLSEHIRRGREVLFR